MEMWRVIVGSAVLPPAAVREGEQRDEGPAPGGGQPPLRHPRARHPGTPPVPVLN